LGIGEVLSMDSFKFWDFLTRVITKLSFHYISLV
jgi:hypothetical protein